MSEPTTIAPKTSADSLRWHFGPTEQDKDSGKMWCYDCAAEVLWLYCDTDKRKGGYICLGCHKTCDD